VLTPRQRDVAELVARGYSNKRIAKETGLALPTVKEHVSAAASRVPGDGPPRYRLIVFMLSDDAA
jgi:DNA-binding NarL/FixJ family response regulator